MRPLVLLRPEPGLTASAERARALGLDVIERPLFAVEPIDWTAHDPAEFDALLLTSANAVLHAGPGLDDYRKLPVHAVGGRTAQAARAAGLAIASEGERGVEALFAALPGANRLLHLGGADRVEADPGANRVTEVTVYRAAQLDDPNLPPLAGHVVAVHSPRAGRRLADVAGADPDAAIAAISHSAAAACGAGWERVEVAEAPTDAALLALAARLCQDSPTP